MRVLHIENLLSTIIFPLTVVNLLWYKPKYGNHQFRRVGRRSEEIDVSRVPPTDHPKMVSRYPTTEGEQVVYRQRPRTRSLGYREMTCAYAADPNGCYEHRNLSILHERPWVLCACTNCKMGVEHARKMALSRLIPSETCPSCGFYKQRRNKRCDDCSHSPQRGKT